MLRLTRPARWLGIALGAFGVVLATSLVGLGAVPTSVSAAPLPSARAYCKVEARIGDLDVLASTRPARVRVDLTRLLALTTRAARVAPMEIHADAWAAVDAQQRFNDLYARHAWRPTPTNLDPDFVALADDPALGGVYQRLERYQRRECDRRDADPSVA